jgi:aquaporin Z
MTGTLRTAVAEFVGTFIFVFAIVGAINNAPAGWAPLVIGFALMIMVFAVGHISGAHLNPAVSLGAWMRGAIDATTFAAYVAAQVAGAALAAGVAMVLGWVSTTPVEIETGPAFLAEALWTFVLVFVVLNVATSKDHDGNSFYGLAIGTTVFVGAATLGGISGGGFNPAVAVGLSMTGDFSWSALWLYVAAPLVGAAVAAVVFKVLNTHDKLPLAAKQ